MADLRILVVADDPLVRAGLATLLTEQPGCIVVGRASSLDDLPAMVKACRPDVVLCDMGWQPDPANERLAMLIESSPPIAVLMTDEGPVAEAWAAGVRAILRRDADPAQIAAALHALAQGLAVVDDAFATALPRRGGSPMLNPWGDRSANPLAEELTARELTVLRLVAEGLPNKTIAVQLSISEHTVKFHINAILGKLGVSSRTEAVVHATRLGLILL